MTDEPPYHALSEYMPMLTIDDPKTIQTKDERGNLVDCIMFTWYDRQTDTSTRIPIPVSAFVDVIFRECQRHVGDELCRHHLESSGYEVKKRSKWKYRLGL